MGRAFRLKIGRFAAVGIVATLGYAVFALTLARLGGLPPLAASVIGYLLAAAFSYLAHRGFTFRSERAHAAAAPRFALTTLCGLALTALLTMAAERIGAPYAAAVAVVCVLVPAFNFLVLDRIVFAPHAAERGR